jgi:hypothetical protein
VRDGEADTAFWFPSYNVCSAYTNPEEQRSAQLIAEARVKAVAVARTLNDALAGTTCWPAIAGDIAVGVVAELNIERSTLVHLEAWYDRLTQREGFRR